MPVQQPIKSSFAKAVISLMMTAFLVACGGGSEGGGNASSPDTASSQVSVVSASSATIIWTAPVARADQTPLSLSEIGGYRVYYGANEGEYTNSIDVNDGSVWQVTLAELPLGTYYFVVTTYDVDGRESEFSQVVVKKI